MARSPSLVRLIGWPCTNSAHAVTRQVFAFAIAEDLVAVNPATGFPLLVEEKPRVRIYRDDKLAALWAVFTDPSDVTDEAGDQRIVDEGYHGAIVGRAVVSSGYSAPADQGAFAEGGHGLRLDLATFEARQAMALATRALSHDVPGRNPTPHTASEAAYRPRSLSITSPPSRPPSSRASPPRRSALGVERWRGISADRHRAA